jgi:hypothetical protein
MSEQTYIDEFESLVTELISIGKGVGYRNNSGKPNDAFDEKLRNTRAREIGTRLDEMGGVTSMREAHSRVLGELGLGPARSLESAWRFIGQWW